MSPARGTARSVLLAVHALPPFEMSGAPLAAFGYARALGEAGWRVTVLSARPGAPPWTAPRATRRPSEPFSRITVPQFLGTGTSWLDAWSVPTVASAGGHDEVDLLLRRLAPDVLHVVDNVFLPLSLPERASRMGIPVVRSVACAEDLCALVVPVSPCSGPAGYCTGPITAAHCASCVGRSESDDSLERFRLTGDPAVDASRRARLLGLLGAQRARAVHQFRAVHDRVLFASEQFRRYFEETVALDPSRVRIVPMGVDLPPHSGRAARRAGAGAAGPVTFLVAGNTNPFKGTGAVVAAFSHPELAGRDDWHLELAGGGDRTRYGPLLADERVTDHGPYDPAALADLVAGADAGISASVFETFHRVTREYLAGGLPVVGSTAFGISDAVVDGRNGLLFDHADPHALRRALVRLLDDRTLLGRLGDGAAATRVRSVEEEAAELASIYEELLALRAARPWAASPAARRPVPSPSSVSSPRTAAPSRTASIPRAAPAPRSGRRA